MCLVVLVVVGEALTPMTQVMGMLSLVSPVMHS